MILQTNPSPKQQALTLLFGGVLPIAVFTVIESLYGIQAGLIAGLIFGVAEMIYEKLRYKSVSSLTWAGNALLIILGSVSLIAQDGIWFKMQPALLEFAFFLFLFGSWIIKKPFLKMMINKQNPGAPEVLKNRMSGLTFRLSVFMLLHALLATWAAFHWSTEAWAFLKGFGLGLSLFVFMLIEVLMTRRFIKKLHSQSV